MAAPTRRPTPIRGIVRVGDPASSWRWSPASPPVRGGVGGRASRGVRSFCFFGRVAKGPGDVSLGIPRYPVPPCGGVRSDTSGGGVTIGR